jgi:hypothetical protein
MSKIDITAPAISGAATLPDGLLQTAAALNATLQTVTDNVGNSSTISLSTTETQINSILRIKTDNAELLDIENSSGNRFNINRDVQKVNLDFASNPTGSTSIVGAIRTFVDSTNLSDVITFIENGTIGINNSSPNDSAQLDIASTTRGFLVPRMTNAQRAAIASPVAGLQVYNSTNNGLAYYDGTAWGYSTGAPQSLTGSGGTLNISFAAGNIINLTLTASTTLTFSGHVQGTYIIKVIQGGSGSYTLTYPASVKWSGGTAPTLTTTVGKIDIITLFHDGTSFFGTYSLNY